MEQKLTKEKIKITVEKRKVTGRKVKKLRKEGILPGNIYGKKVKSLAVQVPLEDFLLVYQKVGETGIVEVKVAGESESRPALIHNVQFDPVSDKPLHVDFHQVSLTEKITTKIPVEIVGKSPAVEQKIGVLIQPLDEIEIEALPTELPDQFTVDISGLKEVDQAITVGDLKAPEGVKILTNAGEILVKIEPPAKEEVAPPPAEEAAPTEEKPAEEKPAGPVGEPKEEEKTPSSEAKPPQKE